MKRYLFSIVTLFILFSGCKSVKTASGEANFDLNKRQLLRENGKRVPQFSTLQSRLKIDYRKGSKTQSHNVTLRMEKDKTIWINATFGVVRAIVTPEGVRFYNKLDGSCFDGDFSYLSDLLGTDLDFQKVQNILLGQAVFELNPKDYKMSVHEQSYLLQPKAQQALFELFFLLNPVHFGLDSQQVAQPQKHRVLQVDYVEHQTVEGEPFPKKIKVIALEEETETIIGLEYKNVVLNERVNTPFKLPSGCDKIEL